jgi:UDP-N-acetylmuramoylalanine--D-glutamate ligase
MLNEGGIKSEACGNIGKPILDAIRDPEGFDALVVELSSFQLHYLGQIFPFSSAVLNLADDHLDWHGGFEEYRAAKAKVFENTVAACVYNVMDKATESMVEDADVVDGARAIGFTLGIPARSQIGFVEDILCDRAYLDDRANNALEIATLEDIGEIGVMTPHLMANVAAATAMARSAGVEPDRIREAIRNFRLDAHRIELVAEAGGIRWIDDSKATNPHAANASLASFDRVVWIVGGLLKGVDISSLVERHKSSLAAAIVIGADRNPVLEALANKAPGVPVAEIPAGTAEEVMHAAVAAAAGFAGEGDVVLLAPAAASMDQFKDYADRGNCFAVAVRSLIGGERG